MIKLNNSLLLMRITSALWQMNDLIENKASAMTLMQAYLL